jgi:Domain of unknown function (DUF4389)
MATLSLYPAQLSVDYPERPLNRLTTFFRAFTVIPIGIILGLLISSGRYATGYIVVPTILMLLFRRKYPRWWFDFNLALTRFTLRVEAYALLLRDEYPSTDEEQAVHIELVYPDAADLNRWLPLVKWLLAIPHYIVLAVLGVASFFCVVIAWFAILFTGQYPRGLFEFVVGVMRWGLRVQAYALLMLTDQYPPFQLGE